MRVLSNNSDLIVSKANFSFFLFQTTGGSDEGQDWELTKVCCSFKKKKRKKKSFNSDQNLPGCFYVFDVFVLTETVFEGRYGCISLYKD